MVWDHAWTVCDSLIPDLARSGVGFQRLTVNEFVAGSIPVGHLRKFEE